MNTDLFAIESKITLLEKNAAIALEMLESCVACPRLCGVDRTRNGLGICGMPAQIKVAAANLHYGEEPPISGSRGSGTIFLSGCNLSCVFCQNYPISQYRAGEFVTFDELADIMLALQNRGAHNINFVTPTHYTPQLMASLLIAYKKGLKIPLVYNSSGYDKVETLRLLEGVIDIYMPDMRYDSNENAARFSGVPDYVETNRAAVREMHKQVGVLQMENDIAVRGLLIRHLVLPDNIAGSKGIFNFVADQISADTYMAVMSQYFPAYRACDIPLLKRRLTKLEYETALDWFNESGLHNGFIQPYEDEG
jgi:putative pyruvate formate lyase activating enzyme